MVFQLVQAGYWLALSVWFGGAVFLAVAAGVIFRVVREQRPVLPQVLAVNLEDQHAMLLGSTLMAQLVKVIGRTQLVMAAATLLGTLLHFFVADTGGTNLTAAIFRAFLAVIATGVLAYDRLIVFPRLQAARQTYIDHADEPELANPARDTFHRDQQLSLTLLMVQVALLAGLILFSSAITPASDLRILTDRPA